MQLWVSQSETRQDSASERKNRENLGGAFAPNAPPLLQPWFSAGGLGPAQGPQKLWGYCCSVVHSRALLGWKLKTETKSFKPFFKMQFGKLTTWPPDSKFTGSECRAKLYSHTNLWRRLYGQHDLWWKRQMRNLDNTNVHRAQWKVLCSMIKTYYAWCRDWLFYYMRSDCLRFVIYI